MIASVQSVALHPQEGSVRPRMLIASLALCQLDPCCNYRVLVRIRRFPGEVRTKEMRMYDCWERLGRLSGSELPNFAERWKKWEQGLHG
jgi:hypothetical protein